MEQVEGQEKFGPSPNFVTCGMFMTHSSKLISLILSFN